jgi:NCAIR mutase (PurE)-related protein
MQLACSFVFRRYILEAREILTRFKRNEITLEEAEHYFRKEPFEKMDDYAKLDSHREIRSGFPEVIFCSGKADEHFVRIFQKLYEQNGEVLGTRASRHQYELVKELLPGVEYDEVSHIIKIEKKEKKHTGKIAVCTAGTADIPVAEEAAQTAEYFGAHVDRIFDVGVSGIHRLFSSLDVIQEANCVVAVAGMEGALASVLGGLVDKPVIAVPTSVGYGASMHGLSALLTMINSCANGIAVVNIDNGYGAGYIATQINRLAVRETEEE